MASSTKILEPIDWVSVRERMARAIRSTEAAMTLSPERARQVLDDRARALAVPVQRESPAGERVDALTFQLSCERFAIETRCVREVVPLQKITPLPRTADFVAGIINLRGDLIPVFDLRRLLGLAADASGIPSHIIVVGEGQAEFGMTVDELPRVGGISIGTLTAVADPGTGDGRPWLRGVTGDAVMVIEGSALIADHRLFLE
ncbi:MAG: purine-binding chemotaxis protein CheW [Mesorhizobium sp.]|nr:MAG: purine-binding chemotaxis protein CheW [Mesorhizobium sp.]TJW47925.1 MAG: purine-binding chemotaxis protein CheW [Mesorhizobium sp.]